MEHRTQNLMTWFRPCIRGIHSMAEGHLNFLVFIFHFIWKRELRREKDLDRQPDRERIFIFWFATWRPATARTRPKPSAYNGIQASTMSGRDPAVGDAIGYVWRCAVAGSWELELEPSTVKESTLSGVLCCCMCYAMYPFYESVFKNDLFEGGTEREVFHALVYFPSGWYFKDWVRLKPEAKSFIWSSHVVGRDPSTLVSSIIVSGHYQEPGWEMKLLGY